jgi:hypothetical protein
MTDDPKWLASSIFAALVVGLFALDVGVAARARGDRRWLAGAMSALWIAGAAGFTVVVHVALDQHEHEQQERRAPASARPHEEPPGAAERVGPGNRRRSSERRRDCRC